MPGQAGGLQSRRVDSEATFACDLPLFGNLLEPLKDSARQIHPPFFLFTPSL